MRNTNVPSHGTTISRGVVFFLRCGSTHFSLSTKRICISRNIDGPRLEKEIVRPSIEEYDGV